MELNCPNITSCNLVLNIGPSGSKSKQEMYIQKYCNGQNKFWQNCTRYIVKNAINFCPDFVLPDSNMTPDEVIDKFDCGND